MRRRTDTNRAAKEDALSPRMGRAVRRFTVPALALLLAAVAAPVLALDPVAPPGRGNDAVPPAALPGIWRIDWSKSDARPRVDGSWIQGSAPDGAPGADGAQGPARRARRRAPDRDGALAPSRPYAAQTIIIFQRGAHLEISEDGRAAEPVDLDAMAVNATARRYTTIQEGRWENPNLILTRTVPGGGTMTQTFTLATAGDVLEMSARIQRDFDQAPLLIHRVYTKFRG